MKRKAKQNGSGGCLRLGLLLASVAVLLLVPVAAASAFEPVTVIPEGEGSGTVENSSHEAVGIGDTLICHWNGTEVDEDIDSNPGNGICEDETFIAEGFEGYVALRSADLGSEFGGAWTVEGITPISGCKAVSNFCSAIFPTGPVTFKVPFALEPKEWKLNLTTSGTGSGSFECEVESVVGACQEKYLENEEVTVIPVAGSGSEFVEWSGDCTGSGTCTVTSVEEARNVNAQFDKETFTLTAEVVGEGEVTAPGITCTEAGNGGPECEAVFSYGDKVEAAATPNSVEYVVAGLTGGGSAAGSCSIAGGGVSGECEFTITANSSVTAEFASAEYKDELTVDPVHGEVPETTALETPAEGEPGSCTDVDLGEFLPGVTDDYTNTCSLTLTSTGAETLLTARDTSATHTGHLVQGSYFLLSLLKAKAEDSQENGTSTGLVSLNENPEAEFAVTLLEFGVPIAKDATTLEFSQHIDEEEGLHTGEYSKTILLTLEQTA